ncbi:MAG: hypothetical protein ACYCPW_02985 [Nitrososphaerales archaeon]
MDQKSFEDKILECVDRGMASLGESATKAILWHIEQNSHLKHKEIPTKPQQFNDALKKMLGPGATVLETTIVREMKMKFSIRASTETFEKAVSDAKSTVEINSK